jgi:radical SAM protein with 4Fe4S-binding SPASM domain
MNRRKIIMIKHFLNQAGAPIGPVLGDWNITVDVTGQTASKKFQVKIISNHSDKKKLSCVFCKMKHFCFLGCGVHPSKVRGRHRVAGLRKSGGTFN